MYLISDIASRSCYCPTATEFVFPDDFLSVLAHLTTACYCKSMCTTLPKKRLQCSLSLTGSCLCAVWAWGQFIGMHPPACSCIALMLCCSILASVNLKTDHVTTHAVCIAMSLELHIALLATEQQILAKDVFEHTALNVMHSCRPRRRWIRGRRRICAT